MTQEENTYIFDPESTVEMTRLIAQDQLITRGMGGPLSGVPELPIEAQLLDLGCGPGGWVLDVAYTCPDVDVAGIDISKTMTTYANARARSQLLKNASFGVMDLREPLDFSDASFDLVNARFLAAVLLREAWEPLLRECTRILKPGGVLRFTEPVDFGVTNSVTYELVVSLFVKALWKGGHGFSLDGRTCGITNTLPGLFRALGYQHVRCHAHAIEFSADQDAWQGMYDNFQAGMNIAPPLYVKTGLGTEEEMRERYQQVLREMLSPDFRGMWHLVTVVGTKP